MAEQRRKVSDVSSAELNPWKIATAVALMLSAPFASAHADQNNRFNLLEENDSLYFHSDKHYTQGLRLSNLGPDVEPQSGWNGPFNLLDDLLPIFSHDAERPLAR
jgi:hypothetical protein